MTIATARTLLLPYTEQLEHDFILLNCCPTNRLEMNGPHTVSSAKRLFQTLLNGELNFSRAVIDNKTREYIGHLAISNTDGHHELIYVLDKKCWGKGIASEVLRSFFSMACFELQLSKVVATVNIHHTSSIKLLDSLGFTLNETKHDEFGPYYEYCFLSNSATASYGVAAQSA